MGRARARSAQEGAPSPAAPTIRQDSPVLTRLAPCVMMSPLSIAQYLPPRRQALRRRRVRRGLAGPRFGTPIGAIPGGCRSWSFWAIQTVAAHQRRPAQRGWGGRRYGERPDAAEHPGRVLVVDPPCAQADLALSQPSREPDRFLQRQILWRRTRHVPPPVTRDAAVRFVEVAGGVYERGKAMNRRKRKPS